MYDVKTLQTPGKNELTTFQYILVLQYMQKSQTELLPMIIMYFKKKI